MKIDPVAAMWMPGVRTTALPPATSPIAFLAFLTDLELAAVPVEPAQQGDSAPTEEQDQPEREGTVETGRDVLAEPVLPLPRSAPVAWHMAPAPGDSGRVGLPPLAFVAVQPIAAQHEPMQVVAATPEAGQWHEPGQEAAPPRLGIPVATDVLGKAPEPGKTPPLPETSSVAPPWRRGEAAPTETRDTTVPDLRVDAKGGQSAPASPLATPVATPPALALMMPKAARPADSAMPERIETTPVSYPRQPQAAQRAIEYSLAIMPEPSRHAAPPEDTDRPQGRPGDANLPANKAQMPPLPASAPAMTSVADTDGPGQPAPSSPLSQPMSKNLPISADVSAVSQTLGAKAMIPVQRPAMFRPAPVMLNLPAEAVSPAKAAPADAAPIPRHLPAEAVSPAKAAPSDATPIPRHLPAEAVSPAKAAPADAAPILRHLPAEAVPSAKAAPADAAPIPRQTELPAIIKSDQPLAAPIPVGAERLAPAPDRSGWLQPTHSESARAAPAAPPGARPDPRTDTLPPGTAKQNRQTAKISPLNLRHAAAPIPATPAEATTPDLPTMSRPPAPAEVTDTLTYRTRPAPVELPIAGTDSDAPPARPQTATMPVDETRQSTAGILPPPHTGPQQPAPPHTARWGIALAGRIGGHDRLIPPLAQAADPVLSTRAYRAAALSPALDVPQSLATDLPLAMPVSLPTSVEQPTLQDGALGLRLDPASPSGPADPHHPRHAPPDARPAPPIPQQIAEAVRQTTGAQIELTLSPDELGRVTLSFQPEGEGLRVHLVTERPETLDLLRRHLPELAGELRAAGYDTASFSFGRQGQAPRDSPDAAPGTLSDPAPDAPPLPTPLRVASGTLDIRL